MHTYIFFRHTFCFSFISIYPIMFFYLVISCRLSFSSYVTVCYHFTIKVIYRFRVNGESSFFFFDIVASPCAGYSRFLSAPRRARRPSTLSLVRHKSSWRVNIRPTMLIENMNIEPTEYFQVGLVSLLNPEII